MSAENGTNGTGMGANGNGAGKPPKGMGRLRRLDRPRTQTVLSPDYACLGLLIAFGLVLLSVAVWVTVYLTHVPELNGH